MTPQRLLLFDIDGTLLRGKKAMYYRMFEELVQDLWGREISLEGYRFGGRTDREIVAHIATLAQISEEEFERAEEELIAHFPKRLAAFINTDTFELLPNVVPLLEHVSGREDMLVALLTGNLPECASLKLGLFDLEKYFQFGVYGIESKDRNDLGPIALERANALYPNQFTGRNTVIIGDAVNDIRCAKAIGAISLITLTGKIEKERLLAEEPTFMFDDLSDTAAVVEAMLS